MEQNIRDTERFLEYSDDDKIESGGDEPSPKLVQFSWIGEKYFASDGNGFWSLPSKVSGSILIPGALLSCELMEMHLYWNLIR